MNEQALNYIQSILAEIRVHTQDYMINLDTYHREETQRVRDQLSILTVQLADMYGDLEEDFNQIQMEYTKKLREEHLRLWEIYQSDDPLINPEGKLSRSVAQDKARYRSVIEAHHLTGQLNKLRGLKERANGLWRYTLPKVLDSIASRIALQDKYPEGIPDKAKRVSAHHKSTFDDIFGDLAENIDEASKEIASIQNEYTDNDSYTEQGFFDQNL